MLALCGILVDAARLLGTDQGEKCAMTDFPTNFVSSEDGLDYSWTYEKDAKLVLVIDGLLALLLPCLCCLGSCSGLLLEPVEVGFL